jgi:hypothetical protein
MRGGLESVLMPHLKYDQIVIRAPIAKRYRLCKASTGSKDRKAFIHKLTESIGTDRVQTSTWIVDYSTRV